MAAQGSRLVRLGDSQNFERPRASEDLGFDDIAAFVDGHQNSRTALKPVGTLLVLITFDIRPGGRRTSSPARRGCKRSAAARGSDDRSLAVPGVCTSLDRQPFLLEFLPAGIAAAGTPRLRRWRCGTDGRLGGAARHLRGNPP